MKEKYDQIGLGYNHTRKADPYLTAQLYQHLAPQPAGHYLDIGCGTGNYTIALHQKGVRFTGVEPSTRMLEKARSACQSINWLEGKAEAIPLADASMDGAIASLTIHHWTDLAQGFAELYRVLRPASKLVVFTSTPQQMRGYWLQHYFPKMLEDSMQQMPTAAAVIQHLQESGFQSIQQAKYFVRPDLIDQFLYVGKHQPNLYLDASIRKGISSFSALANQVEVSRGLQQLQADIASQQIDKIIQQYENQMGDYLYFIVDKP